MPQTADPVADLVATGIAYRRYAIKRPHMYRLMFGSTSAHGINAPAHNVLTLAVVAIAAQFWAAIHGFVMLELAGYYGADASVVVGLEVSVDDAFTLLRRHARTHGDHLTELSRRLITEPEARQTILAAMTQMMGAPAS